MAEYMLTTVDNPYNPHTHWDEWYAYDERMGYYTPGFLARVTFTSPSLPHEEQELDVQRAIDEIVEYNVLGIYAKIKKDELPYPKRKSKRIKS